MDGPGVSIVAVEESHDQTTTQLEGSPASVGLELSMNCEDPVPNFSSNELQLFERMDTTFSLIIALAIPFRFCSLSPSSLNVNLCPFAHQLADIHFFNWEETRGRQGGDPAPPLFFQGGAEPLHFLHAAV